ncbi:sensor histidine kinase [Candidatus Enterococcus mansonii]|uniref:sensor histidine kinase n=1 Tax=Candidatus Enterococcus mansonii TaxID=1834181 RepID=UPI001C4EE214|nr:GHKL domain-containing protein [Enterococcus sp. 4G2_DIV0659]
MLDHLISFFLFSNELEIIEKIGLEGDSQLRILLRVGLYVAFMVFTAICFKVGQQFLGKKVRFDDNILKVIAILSFVLYLILYISIIFTVIEGNQLNTIRLNNIFFSLYVLFTFLLIAITYFYMKKRSEDQYKEKEKQNLKEYTTYLESNYNELRKFRHDYQNILTSLESFIEEDDFERLKDYYYQSIQKTQRLMQKNDFKLSEISHLEVTEIKSIVVSKLLQSQWAGIDTELEMKEVIDDINMDPVTLIRCLGIILDNAIEETKGNAEGFIRMAIIKEIHSLSFIVQNTIKADHPKLFEMNRSGFSTKGENRGLGLSNLKEMIDKQANVTLETSIDDRCFVQKIEITK